MKRRLAGVSIVVLIVFATCNGNATIINRGNGLIYDSDQNLTWLQDANYAKTSGYDSDGLMNWYDANAWADQLVYEGYDDWRLPTAIDGPIVMGYDGTTTAGYNITTSEMGYMFYVNLGNKAYFSTDGTSPQPGWGLTNYSYIINLQSYDYWTGTETSVNPNNAFDFNFNSGGQGYGNFKGDDYRAWAVCNGDVAAPIPEPATMLLMGIGIAGLLGARRKKKSSNSRHELQQNFS